MKRFRFNQQEIVFAVFAALFLAFSILLRGFLTPENMLTLLQNVAVLGILGLASRRWPCRRAWSCRWCRTATRFQPRSPPPSH